MRVRHRQVLPVRQNRRRSDRLVVADDSPEGKVAAGRVPAEDGLRAQIMQAAVGVQDFQGGVFETDHGRKLVVDVPHDVFDGISGDQGNPYRYTNAHGTHRILDSFLVASAAGGYGNE